MERPVGIGRREALTGLRQTQSTFPFLRRGWDFTDRCASVVNEELMQEQAKREAAWTTSGTI